MNSAPILRRRATSTTSASNSAKPPRSSRRTSRNLRFLMTANTNSAVSSCRAPFPKMDGVEDATALERKKPHPVPSVLRGVDANVADGCLSGDGVRDMGLLKFAYQQANRSKRIRRFPDNSWVAVPPIATGERSEGAR